MDKFNEETNGYSKNEVNAFLNSVIRETEKMLTKLKQQQSEIMILNHKINHYQNMEKSLNIAMDHAEKTREEIRKRASNEAEIIVEEANRNADRIVNDALIRNEEIEGRVRNTEHNLKVLKKKLRSIVNQQMEVVEEIELLEVEE